MNEKLDINELLVLENELKLMAIISNTIVNNRLSLEERYNFIVRDVIFPQINPVMEVSNSSRIWVLARYIVNDKDIRQLNNSNIIIMRGSGVSSKTINRKRFVQEIIKSFDIKSNKEIENCLSRIVKMLETLIQQNIHIKFHDISTKETVINNSHIISYESNIESIIKSKK
jgi:hypothetical protein